MGSLRQVHTRRHGGRGSAEQRDASDSRGPVMGERDRARHSEWPRPVSTLRVQYGPRHKALDTQVVTPPGAKASSDCMVPFLTTIWGGDC